MRECRVKHGASITGKERSALRKKSYLERSLVCLALEAPQLMHSALNAAPTRWVRNPYNGAIDDAYEVLELLAIGSKIGVVES